MRLRYSAWVFVAAMACSSSGTSGESAATSAAVTAGGAAASAAGAPTVPWSQMNHEQQEEYMEHTVMPEMQRMFQEFDAQRFANFSCRTCHGPNAREVRFHMPNGIAPLDPARLPAMFQSQEPIHVFMTQRVWPRMTALLGKQPYNPETHQGFGCLGCHGTTGGTTPAAY